MKQFKTQFKSNKSILALGAESAGNFSIYHNDEIVYYTDFGDLLVEKNFEKYSNSIYSILEKNKFIPDIVVIDLHPLFRTRELGEKLSEEYDCELVEVQHHLAHIFSALGENIIDTPSNLPLNRGKINLFPLIFRRGLGEVFSKRILGVACDGTGYGFDEKIWGGEVFDIDLGKKEFKRIARLENHLLIGGEKAILEPARMLLGILGKFLSKDEVYNNVKEYYSENEFELLFNQSKEKFNCLETSSTGRVLDAVSILLGFISNESKYKHEPIDQLEKNSEDSFNIEPVVLFDDEEDLKIIKTTPLFEYLIKNISKDKKRLAGTAQMYLAKAIYEILKDKNEKVYFAGGIAHNKIISEYLESQNIITNNELPRGDNGISFGQIIYAILMT